VIVVGDACTDDSEQVVRAFRDPRVRWDNLAENSGSQSLPNNRGIELARGDYIAYLGHDDLWHPNHLAYLVSAAEHSDASLALAASLTIGPPGSNARTLMNWVFPSAALHRRDAVDRVGPWRDFRTIVEAPDEEFLGRMAAAGGRVWSNALTLWKLPSAMRSSSYVERRSDEQAKLARRMRSERFFVERELAAWLWLRVRSPELHLPERDPLPEPVPPGWYVRQLRKIRGLPEEPVPRGEGRDG
jgi:glycosyltransferase involved in cell wall biosynthesis